LTVEELLRQVGETEAVISARYHNLVAALIQNKPVIYGRQKPCEGPKESTWAAPLL
jgi:hypothetical protein